MERRAEVVVVGGPNPDKLQCDPHPIQFMSAGGVSGLFAALRLVEEGRHSVTLLEAADRLGGRVHTVQHNGSPLDLGAQWIHGRGECPLWQFVKVQAGVL